MNQTNLDKYYDWAPLLLRIGVGVVFIVAGWGKMQGMTGALFSGADWGFPNRVESIGFPLPFFFASLVAIIEFFGGLMVLLGAYVRVPALLLAFVMVVALFTTKLGGEFSAARLDLMLLLMNGSIAILGSGKYSIDNYMNKGSHM